jgi:hypothetical protein
MCTFKCTLYKVRSQRFNFEILGYVLLFVFVMSKYQMTDCNFYRPCTKCETHLMVWSQTADISTVLNVGDRTEVKVTTVDINHCRISLGLLRVLRHVSVCKYSSSHFEKEHISTEYVGIMQCKSKETTRHNEYLITDQMIWKQICSCFSQWASEVVYITLNGFSVVSHITQMCSCHCSSCNRLKYNYRFSCNKEIFKYLSGEVTWGYTVTFFFLSYKWANLL